eukprot:1837863-Pleurochrysis_carterae.AAC.1
MTAKAWLMSCGDNPEENMASHEGAEIVFDPPNGNIHGTIAAVRAAGELHELLLAAQSETSDWQLCLLWC